MHTRRRPLSRDRVLTVAMQVADSDGLEAVTMRNVASQVGVEAMSLYHHVPGKGGLLDGLVELIAEQVQEQVAQLQPVSDWRQQVRARCLAARTVMLAHPWAPSLISSRQTIPPSLHVLFEEVLATMVQGGVSYHLGHRALHSLGSMLLGFSQELFSMGPPDEAEEVGSEEDFAAMAEVLPHLAAMAASEFHDSSDPTLGWCDSQSEFEFTLDLLLDGLDRARARADSSP